LGFGGGFANLYEYADNDPINAVDPSGLQTLQVGVTINIQWGPITGVYSRSIAIDTYGNVGVVRTFGVGGGAGSGFHVTGGGSLAGSNAVTICDLRGPFSYGSLGAGDGLGASIDAFSGPSKNGWVAGGGFTAGATLGAGGSTGGTQTFVTPFWDLW
jgi:hypothetical protein